MSEVIKVRRLLTKAGFDVRAVSKGLWAYTVGPYTVLLDCSDATGTGKVSFRFPEPEKINDKDAKFYTVSGPMDYYFVEDLLLTHGFISSHMI